MSVPFVLMFIGAALVLGMLGWKYIPKFLQFRAEAPERAREHLDQVLADQPTGTSRMRAAQAKSVIMINGQPTVVGGKALGLELKFFNRQRKEDKTHVNPRTGEPLREFPMIME